MAQLRTSKNKGLPVHIVEQHNDVVPFLHRAIGSKLLPYSDIPMIHLDSHPDMLIPINSPADIVFQPQELYESLSIENWLLPLTYAKHFSHLVWVKPPWAHQINESEQSFTIGKCSGSGKMRLTCKENYFLTEGLFCAAKGMDNTNEVKLSVVELRPDEWMELQSCEVFNDHLATKSIPENTEQPATILSSNEKLAAHLQDIVSNKPYVLDIDLDFFSTANPFRGMLRPDEEQALRRLYHYPAITDLSDQSIAAFTQTREKQISQLENIFSDLETKWFGEKASCSEAELQGFSIADLTGEGGKCVMFLDPQQESDLTFLCRSVLQHRKDRDVTFIVLHYFGCTLDDTELPHHISTPAQVTALMACFKDVLQHLPRPSVVTIARSSEDGYCPTEAVDKYQNDVLKIIEDLHGSLQISKSYEEMDV